MAIALKHTKTLAKADGIDVTVVQPSDWNAGHTLTALAGKVLGTAVGSTTVSELPLEVDATLQSVKVPSGSTAARPASPGSGMLRYNTTTSRLEYYTDGAWKNVDNMSVSGTAPSAPIAGDLWIDTASGNALKIYVAGAWQVVLGDGSITSAKLATSVQQSLAPTGALMAYAGASAPSGWLLCAGQAVNRTTYAALFATLSTAYGAGDGSTTFNLPDLRGRVPAGKDDMGGTSAARLNSLASTTLGGSGGAQAHTLAESEMPSHEHFVASNTNASSPLSNTNYVAKTYDGTSNLDYSLRGNATAATVGLSSTAGADGAHNNVQPTIILNYIIKT